MEGDVTGTESVLEIKRKNPPAHFSLHKLIFTLSLKSHHYINPVSINRLFIVFYAKDGTSGLKFLKIKLKNPSFPQAWILSSRKPQWSSVNFLLELFYNTTVPLSQTAENILTFRNFPCTFLRSQNEGMSAWPAASVDTEDFFFSPSSCGLCLCKDLQSGNSICEAVLSLSTQTWQKVL